MHSSIPSATAGESPATLAPDDRASPRARPIVAIQGELGSFSHEAVTRFWKGNGIALPQITCAQVISAVSTGRATHGVLAMENSIAGAVDEAHDALAAAPQIVVVGEIVVPIIQCLLAPPGATLDSVRAVYSHPIALRQCARFLDAHPQLDPRDAYDTAGAARDVSARGSTREAAVAGRAAAARYGLRVLAEEIGDRADNETTFRVVALRNQHAGDRKPTARPATAPVGAVRGATTVAADETMLIHEATTQLLAELLTRNDLTTERVISAIFTVTADLRSEFPARAARDLGFHEVPMISAVEVAVPGALPRCIRVLLHVTGPLPSARGRSIYLRGAAALRPDLSASTPAGSGWPES